MLVAIYHQENGSCVIGELSEESLSGRLGGIKGVVGERVGSPLQSQSGFTINVMFPDEPRMNVTWETLH
jgi:hypothetical protein